MRGDRIGSPAATRRMAVAISGGRGVLQQEPARAGPERPQHVLVRVERRQHDHLGRVRPRADPGRRGDAVHARHPDVHQHDVGRVGVERRRHLVAVARLADDPQAVRAVEHHREAGPHQRVVVDDQDPDHAGHGSDADTRNSVAVARWSSWPPASRTRSVSPTRPVPAPGIDRRRAERVRHVDRQPGAGRAVQRDPHRLARRVLACVGQRLLHHPVRGPRRSCPAPPPVDLVVQLDRRADRPRLLDQRRQVGQRGHRPRQVVGRLVPQQRDHVPQLVQRLVHGGPDDPGRLRQPLRRLVGPVLEGAGVGREQRQPVREHVVHLPRDGRPLGRPRLRDPPALLGLRPLGPLPQRGDHRRPRRRELHPNRRARRAGRSPASATSRRTSRWSAATAHGWRAHRPRRPRPRRPRAAAGYRRCA